jgi:hypothetical protein
MTALATPIPDARAIFEDAIARLLTGDMKDTKNDNGLTYLQQLAHDMFADPKMAAKLTASARLPGVKASLERAAALNAPKLALLELAGRCKKLGRYTRRDGRPAPHFYLDLPYCLRQLDQSHGEHVYLPVNRHYKPLGQEQHAHGAYEDHAGQAWHFRRDPHEIEGAWSKTDRSYFYVGEDVGRYRTERAFLEAYRDDRLRRVLAEAVPGVGGLRLEPE